MNNICAGEKIIHHRGTEFTEVLFVLLIGRKADGQNTSCPNAQRRQNTYFYLHPMIMMKYVCAGEVRCTLRLSNHQYSLNIEHRTLNIEHRILTIEH